MIASVVISRVIVSSYSTELLSSGEVPYVLLLSSRRQNACGFFEDDHVRLTKDNNKIMILETTPGAPGRLFTFVFVHWAQTIYTQTVVE